MGMGFRSVYTTAPRCVLGSLRTQKRWRSPNVDEESVFWGQSTKEKESGGLGTNKVETLLTKYTLIGYNFEMVEISL